MKLAVTFATLACLALLGCTQQASDAQPDSSEALTAADASFQKAVATKDLTKIVSFYADTAVLMPAAEPIVSGKAAIAKEWEHVLAIPAFENTSKLTRVETSASNDLGYTMGTYTSRLMGEDGKLVAEPGKWLSVWKKQADGSWKVVVDTYNTDIKPPDHK